MTLSRFWDWYLAVYLSRRFASDCAIHVAVHSYFVLSLFHHDMLATCVAVVTALINVVLLWLQHDHYDTFTTCRNGLVAVQRLAAAYLAVACFTLEPSQLVLPQSAPGVLRLLVHSGALPLAVCNLLMELPLVWEGACGVLGFLALAVNNHKLCHSLQGCGPLLRETSAATGKLVQLVMVPVVQLPSRYQVPLLDCQALLTFHQLLLGCALPITIVVVVQNRHLYEYLGSAPLGPHVREVLRQRHRFWGAATYYHIVLLGLVLSTTAVLGWFTLCIMQAAAGRK